MASLELAVDGLRIGAAAAGPDDGELVVLLHGFPDDRDTFAQQLPALAGAGYRAVSVSLRGYEPSSIPADGDHDLMTLARDVVEVIDALGRSRAHLVGHDWGAAIGYVCGAIAPDRLRSLTAIAVPPVARIPEALRHVPVQVLRSWYMTFFQLRGVADLALSARGWWLARRLWRAWSPGHDLADGDWERLRSRFEAPGVRRAMLAYYRQNATPPILLGLRTTEAMALTEVPVPTLAITGADDGCIDTRLFDHAIRAADFPAGFRVERIAGAGHFLHLERPEVLNALLLGWLAEH